MCPDCEKKFSFKKSIIVIGVVALGLWGLQSYGEDNVDHSQMDHSKMNHSTMKQGKMSQGGNRKHLSDETKSSVLKVLESYEKLHQAFFKYDAKKVEKNALETQEAINSIKDKEISKLLRFSKEKLSQIKATNDREANNKNYNLVSMALIHVVKNYDVGGDFNAYSCPMVKMKWIQNSSKESELQNPYAPDMPHCGSQDSHYK